MPKFLFAEIFICLQFSGHFSLRMSGGFFHSLLIHIVSIGRVFANNQITVCSESNLYVKDMLPWGGTSDTDTW